MIKEEYITKSIMKNLKIEGWKILSFDFPQSGTGTTIHPNRKGSSHKNKDMITPDLIAIKGEDLLVMENKDRFYEYDLQKLYSIKSKNFDYSIKTNFPNEKYTNIFVGVGVPSSNYISNKIDDSKTPIDFVIFVDKYENHIIKYYNKKMNSLNVKNSKSIFENKNN